MKIIFERHKYAFLVGLLLIIAFIIRAWNFGDWLYFKPDQARDAELIRYAVDNGVENLPLLGPKAGGTFLRLGPIFYYFQYLSAKLTGSLHPAVMAYPDLIFSTLSIVVFYCLLNQFFSKKRSILLSVLYSFCFILVQYSRFAWNPNQIPFWGLLYILALYQTAAINDLNKSGKWLLLMAASYAVASQLHFLALLGFPLVALIFWIFYRPFKINWKYWLAALGILVVFYVPVLVSEYLTKADNFHQFKYALTHKTQPHGVFQTVEKTFSVYSRYYFEILTGFDFRNHIISKIFIGILLLISGYIGYDYFKKETDEKKKKFLVLIFAWFIGFGVIYYKLAFAIEEPRFWLLTIAIPFILLGLILKRISSLKYGNVISLVILVGLLITNILAVGKWYSFLAYPKPEDSLIKLINPKQDDKVGVQDLELVAAYMHDRAKEHNKGVCFSSVSNYNSGLEYVYRVNYSDIPAKRIKAEDPDAYCQFFLVETTFNEGKIAEKVQKGFEKGQLQRFGAMQVWELEPKNKSTVALSFPQIKEYFDLKRQEEDEPDVPLISENSEKNVRLPRLYWKDVLK